MEITRKEAFSWAHDIKKQPRLRTRIYIAIEHKVSGDLHDSKTDVRNV